jgi:chemotaxis methyl-accepting protein methylase/regulator of replication initiation timing
MTYFREHPSPDILETGLGSIEAEFVNDILNELHTRTGRDFSQYKKNSVFRRLERRMSIHHISNISQYANYVKENSQELDLLFKELLIGVTNFFRDPPVWSYLVEQAIPALLEANRAGKAFRAWVAGCSTGEEAYSLAIAFKEATEKLNSDGRFSLRIFATDLDRDAIIKARQGLYPNTIETEISLRRLKRFFVKEDVGYRVRQEIREMATFAPQDIVLDSPFTKLDILTCRNLLIYLSAELHKKLIPLFHYSLRSGGILVLGSAESIGSFTNLFTPLERKARVYQRIETSLNATAIDFPTGALPFTLHYPQKTEPVPAANNMQAIADRLLLQQFSPAAVLVNSNGDIVYISGRTGPFLEPAAGKANWNVHAMAREELRTPLTTALTKAIRNKTKVVVEALRVKDGRDVKIIDLTVQWIDKPSTLRGMIMIAFTSVPPRRARRVDKSIPLSLHNVEATELQEALQHAWEENHTLREEMESTREELRAANEELQSNNEELQSTNEELNSSREEMQSMNEELQTINAELLSKLEDLSRSSDDMKNLLDSTDIATIFLDNSLCIRRFTSRSTQLFKLILGDVGRPLSDIVTDLRYPELQKDAHDVLHTLVFKEKQIPTHDARWFKVRIMPYRTQDNVIDGLVMTFSDITSSKTLEAELRGTIRDTCKPN